MVQPDTAEKGQFSDPPKILAVVLLIGIIVFILLFITRGPSFQASDAIKNMLGQSGEKVGEQIDDTDVSSDQGSSGGLFGSGSGTGSSGGGTGTPIDTGPPSDYEKDVTPPSCDTSNSEVMILDESDSLGSALNRDDKRIFCITPGDYRSQGRITLTADGSEGERRWLRYYNPENPNDNHPWHMADPETMAAPERVLLEGLLFRDGDYWTIDRVRVHRNGIKLRDGSEHNILNRIMIYRKPVWNKDAGNVGGTVAISVRFSDYTTVQNSVIGRTEGGYGPEHGNDAVGVDIGGSAYVHVVGNEIFDMPNGDGVQTHLWGGAGRSKATVVADNDIYLTEAFDGKPIENAIDFKAGGADPSTSSVEDLPQEEWQVVQNNRIWHWRTSNDFTSHAVIFHLPTTSGVIMRDNTIWDIERSAHSIIPKSTKNNNHLVLDNVIYNAGGGLGPQEVKDSEFRRNILIDIEDQDDDPTWRWNGGDSARDNTITHNIFINADVGKPQLEGKGNEITANAFYNSEPFQGDNPDSIIQSSAAAAQHEDLQVQAKQITGPETVTIPNAQVTTSSPHYDWFQSQSE